MEYHGNTGKGNILSMPVTPSGTIHRQQSIRTTDYPTKSLNVVWLQGFSPPINCQQTTADGRPVNTRGKITTVIATVLNAQRSEITGPTGGPVTGGTCMFGWTTPPHVRNWSHKASTTTANVGSFFFFFFHTMKFLCNKFAYPNYLGTFACMNTQGIPEMMKEMTETLSLPRVINYKFPLQPDQKYCRSYSLKNLAFYIVRYKLIILHNLVPRAFWRAGEKALASAGHVINQTPENLGWINYCARRRWRIYAAEFDCPS